MRKYQVLFAAFVLVFTVPLFLQSPAKAEEGNGVKDWTFLVFLNGKNSLDSFGALDINEMEKVGSTDKINVLVQWASTSNHKTQRLYVQKDNDPNRVTSPVVQDMGSVDMGDWRSLVEFVQWGVANYPAKHYFIDVWDHGSGWHLNSGGFSPRDISWDDDTGHFMTTKQLGQALAEAAKAIGHKVDLYGSDACLMGMAEVAGEMSNSVEFSVGSEETEPGEGWPYDGLLSRWSALPTASASDVAKILTTEYVKSYQGGSQGKSEVTFSAFDLSKLNKVSFAVKSLGEAMLKLDSAAVKKVVSAANAAQNFAYSDYVDVLDFLKHVETAQVVGLDADVFTSVRDAVGEFVIANASTSSYQNALGLAIWIPSYYSSYSSYAEKYKTMNFNIATHWGDALRYLLQGTAN